MKNRNQHKGLTKPWGRTRIVTAPAGIRHKSSKDYNRHQLPAISEDWGDELDEDSGGRSS